MLFLAKYSRAFPIGMICQMKEKGVLIERYYYIEQVSMHKGAPSYSLRGAKMSGKRWVEDNGWGRAWIDHEDIIPHG